MKNLLVTGLIAVSFSFASCENRSEPIPESDFEKLPSLTVEKFTTTMSDSGMTEVILRAPLMERYDSRDNPYTEFRQGINVIFYDRKPEPQGTVTSRYARYDQDKDLWELKDSVVVINNEGDKLETELLNWDQKKDLIYTDRFVKITGTDQIIQGFGFESDSHLRRQKIRKVSATIYLDE
ncbi:MAG TPA: LPS export ABC transporter periplasmic protein LptC [Bacteroidales bacterium]|nr:LPS export ABC transporter periplasmic protein LptC [Bacteroidales bacterium]